MEKSIEAMEFHQNWPLRRYGGCGIAWREGLVGRNATRFRFEKVALWGKHHQLCRGSSGRILWGLQCSGGLRGLAVLVRLWTGQLAGFVRC